LTVKKKFYYPLFLVFILCYGCLEVYNPPEIQDNNLYMVMEGFLNVTDKSCTIKLTRTIALAGDSEPQPLDDVTVTVESDDNRRFILIPQSNGVYAGQNLQVHSGSTYRLRIQDGEDVYVSSFVGVPATPPIDEVTWKIEDEKVRVYVSTHNANPGTRCYQWRFEETWEYQSAFRSYFELQGQGNIVPRDEPVELYSCWKNQRSSAINLATTISLAGDVISNYPLRELSMNAAQFQTRYSILVSQFSLSRDEYDFWTQVRDNTAATGTLFDVQPSRIKGNLSCENCNSPILGYFSARTVRQQRIFIKNNQIPLEFFEFDTGYQNCHADTLHLEDVSIFNGPQTIVDELIETIPGDGPRNPPIEKLLGYWVASPFCVDCRLAGGVTTKPPFWD
jgi:hypothetical protein